jgi:hypothetical protein
MNSSLSKEGKIILCTNCGSISKNIKITINDEVALRDNIKLSLKSPKPTGGKKEILRLKQGSEFHHDLKSWQTRIMIIDELKDLYYEKIINKDLRYFIEKKEKLSDHRNHGSAKKKTKK